MPAKKLEGESRPLTKRAVIFGFLLGILYTFVGIYLSYKVGIVAMGGIFLLGYVLLQLTGKYDYKENVILIIIVTSCLLPAFEISDNIAALVIYGEYSGHNIPISFPLLFLMAAVGSLLGIFLLMPFKKQFLKLKWPMVQPSAKMVKAIGGGKQEKKRAFGSMALSAVIAAVTRIGGFSTLGLPSLPSFIGFEVSPMMAGLLYFVCWLCPFGCWSYVFSKRMVFPRRRESESSISRPYYASVYLFHGNRLDGDHSLDSHSTKSRHARGCVQKFENSCWSKS